MRGNSSGKCNHFITYTYNCICRKNEASGRRRQSTIVSTRKPRRNDTRDSANWTLEVTPSREMLFHPRRMPRPTSHPPLTSYQPSYPLLSGRLLYTSSSFCFFFILHRDVVDKEDFENYRGGRDKRVKIIIISYTVSHAVFKCSNENSIISEYLLQIR